ncbi:hypothetical protein OG417_31390 [Actinoallomurus sp. NBC_01490]|jgi:hypothetical protein|uniref:hypothetical protein n=1 Tax=Actinoallomurus sp. NBC_01490 TaxID=2903557 RepID=UPI002E360870|nr:hypothetical protein [Actinoallomurus sp. NBC_01490]
MSLPPGRRDRLDSAASGIWSSVWARASDGRVGAVRLVDIPSDATARRPVGGAIVVLPGKGVR